MRAHIPLILCVLCAPFQIATIQAQQDPPDSPSAKSAQTQGNDHVIEGTVISMTQHTLVVQSDDHQYHLFTYAPAPSTKEPSSPVPVFGLTVVRRTRRHASGRKHRCNPPRR